MMKGVVSEATRTSGKIVFLLVAVVLALGVGLWVDPAWSVPGGPCSDCPDPDPDVASPSVTSVSPAEGATGVAPHVNVTVAFSEPMDSSTITNSTFTLMRQGDGTAVGASVTYNNATDTATLDPNASLDSLAAYTVTVATGATDLAGNALDQDPAASGDQPKAWSFRVEDYTPPSVSNLSPSGGVQRGTISLSASASDNSGSVSRVEFSVRGSLVARDEVAPYSASFNTASVSDGAATIRATAFDAAGNIAYAESSITIDNTAPTLTITGGPNGQTFGAGSTQNWTFSASDPTSGLASVQCSVVPTGSAPSYGACSGGNGSHSVSSKPDGNYTFTLRARDNGGLETTQSRAFSIDATSPETTITDGPPGAQTPTKETTATFSFTSTESGSTFQCRVYRAQTTPGPFVACSGNGTHTVGGLDSGGYTFEVRATDAYGNTDSSPAGRAWVVDATAPTVTGVTPADGAQRVARSTKVTATFSEAMDPSTLNNTTFTLSGPSQNQNAPVVAATVSYDAQTRTATLTPNADLDPSVTYTATVESGASGVKDRVGNPLAADRTWSFTTVKLRVNGRIAFSWEGIYTMKADGTERRRITDNTVGNGHPAFSPDGTKVAFERNNEIYVANANGTNPTPLTNNAHEDRRPAWSPDGTKIAFASFRDANEEIYVMNADGTNQTRLTTYALQDSKPEFSPDGTKLAFHSGRGNAGTDIYVMDASAPEGDANVPQRLTDSAGNDSFPSWSPDGTRIAFLSTRDGNFEIYAMNADGTNQANLTDSPATDNTPSWSPDGTRIAFASDRDDGDTDSRIYVMNANGLNLTGTGAIGSWPSWGDLPNDTAPPQTTLASSGPSGTVNNASATFEFSSEPNAAFDCKLDDGGFEPCSSPKTYNDLPDRQHTFQVRAIDTSGNIDAIPESRTWTSDAVPTVTGVTPTEGASSIAGNTSVTATFSEAMDETSVEAAGTFTLTRQGGTAVAAAVSYDANSKTATLDPNADLAPSTTYVATVKGGASGARDATGNPIATDKTWSFTTAADTQAPEVRLTTPADGATVRGDVQLAAEATDNVKVDYVEFFVNNDKVGSDATAPYAVNWNSASINGDGARITATAYDNAGNQTTSAAHTVTVDNTPDTTAPTVDPASLRPLKAATQVQRNTAVSATFSEAMKAASIVRFDNTSTTFKLQMYNKKTKKWKTIPATVALSNGNTTVTLDPFGPTGTLLAANKKFRATITTGAQDAAGNPLAKPFVWTFTTNKS
jgi:hypothetical protein